MMTTADIEPAILAALREGAEPVIAKTVTGYKPGVRSEGLYAVFGALGRMTVTDDGEVYHSMLGSVPVYTQAEMVEAIKKAEDDVQAMKVALMKTLPLGTYGDVK